jgi:hypothetical protein
VKTIRDLLFADDCALNSGTEPAMLSMDHVSSACNNFGLTISIKKTEVFHQPAPGNAYVEPTISVNNEELNVVDRFTYLGSSLSQAVYIDDVINTRIARACSTFGRRRTHLRRGIKLQTKLKVYNAVVMPSLLYACETWTVYSRHSRKLSHSHLGCLRKLLEIKWYDHIPDTEILEWANMNSVNTRLRKA